MIGLVQDYYLLYRVPPAGSGFNREIHPIIPDSLGIYYYAGEKKIRHGIWNSRAIKDKKI